MPDEFGEELLKYPGQMLRIEDVFAFSFADLAEIVDRFGGQLEMKERLVALQDYLEDHDDDPEFADLVAQELEIANFSIEARSSVMHL